VTTLDDISLLQAKPKNAKKLLANNHRRQISQAVQTKEINLKKSKVHAQHSACIHEKLLTTQHSYEVVDQTSNTTQ